jgi:hypothetical protein
MRYGTVKVRQSTAQLIHIADIEQFTKQVSASPRGEAHREVLSVPLI